MKKLTVFNYNSDVVRTQVDDKGEPLFCLADVCKILEISDPSNTVRQLREEFSEGAVFNTDPLKTIRIETSGGAQSLIFITEPQLYFVMMRSRSNAARPFRQWVVNEVLPSIRKTGKYEVKKEEDTIEFLKKAFEDTVAQIMVLNKTFTVSQKPTQLSLSVPGASLTLYFGMPNKKFYTKVTPEVQSAIVELHRAGLTQHGIAKELGISQASVSRFLKFFN